MHKCTIHLLAAFLSAMLLSACGEPPSDAMLKLATIHMMRDAKMSSEIIEKAKVAAVENVKCKNESTKGHCDFELAGYHISVDLAKTGDGKWVVIPPSTSPF